MILMWNKFFPIEIGNQFIKILFIKHLEPAAHEKLSAHFSALQEQRFVLSWVHVVPQWQGDTVRHLGGSHAVSKLC